MQLGARHAPDAADPFAPIDDEAYEAAFLDKADGAALLGGKRAVSCALCGSDEHATLGGNCPFRGQLLTGGDSGGSGGAGQSGGGNKYTKGDRRNQNNSIKLAVDNPTKVDGSAGDVLKGMWFTKAAGVVVCVSWNKGACNDGRKCKDGRAHVCSFCKGPHRSTHCNTLKRAKGE